MENKYYTPSIEEFHVGFRFERKPFSYNVIGESIKEDWLKCTFCKKDGNRAYHYASLVDNSIQTTSLEKEIILKGIDVSNYRVKYLDKEDIEELGWCFVREIFNNKLDEYVHPNEGESGRTLRVYKDINVKYVVDIGIGYMDFDGESYNIKNYNELKKVMELIGII